MIASPPHVEPLRADILAALRAGEMDDYRELSLIYADSLEESGDGRSAQRRRRKAEAMRPPGLLWPDPWLIAGLTPHQAEQAAKALSRPVGLLTGTPGTGKTYTTARIVARLWHNPRPAGRGGRIAVCAPTGKAAVRISSAMLKEGVTLRASTVHQLLEIGRNGHDGEGWGFRRNANNYLDCDFLIVEEASMLDAGLCASLLAACRPGTHVLLVGDPHQLPPVGHGAPLRDMIAAGLPCGRLTEIRRNAGMIVEACARIKDGLRFETAPLGDSNYDASRNLVLIEAETPDEQAERLRRLVAAAMHDAQVICPLNGGGPVGRAALNAMLQDLLNPGEGDYRRGDKVICLKNGPYPVFGADQDIETAYVANGEMGVVRYNRHGTCEVEFPDPTRNVIVHTGKAAPDPDEFGTHDQGDAPQAERQNFALGYAITGHKSQGSEWPVVAVMLDGSRGAERVCSREWLYTAVSRASRLCVLIGSRKTLAGMLARTELAKRRTRLVSLIGEARKKKGGSR